MIKFVFLITVLFLGGCAHISKNDVAQLSPLPSLEQDIEGAHASGLFQIGTFPSSTWWEMFQDETLSSLIEKGLENNPSLKTAEARLSMAEALARKERGALFPHLGLDYLEDWEHLSKYGFDRDFFPLLQDNAIPHGYNQMDLFFNFTYEFDFWGKNRSLFQAALGKARAERAEVAEAKLLLSIQIARTYLSIQTLLAQQQVIGKRLEEQHQLSSLFRLRQDKGIGSIFPVLDSTNTYEELSHLALYLKGEITVEEHLLHTLLGIGPDDLPPLEKKNLETDLCLFLPETLSSDLLSCRPDLEAQICLVESAASAVGAAKADFYPSINLMAFAGLESLSFNHLFNISSRMGGLQPAFHLPIFKGGEIRANLKEKVGAFNAAVHTYHSLILKAAEEVTNAIFLIQTRHQDLNVHQTQLSIQERLFELTSLKQKQGLGTAQEVLFKEEDLLQEEFAFFAAQKTYLLTVLDLVRALGGGYQSPLVHKEPHL